MKNVIAMINKAVGASGESITLLVEPSAHVGGQFNAALLNVTEDGSLGDSVTLESDWDVALEASGDSIEQALANLDALCAKDFA